MSKLFRKKLLIIKIIINSDCFSQNKSLKSAFEILNKKQLGFLLSLFRLFIMHNRVSSYQIKKTFNFENRSEGANVNKIRLG